MKNKFLVPVGRDDEGYFRLLAKYETSIGGVYLGWPGAPTGRTNSSPSPAFFKRVFEWCRAHGKVFDIVLNMQAHDFTAGFDPRGMDLEPYRCENTELTIASMFLFRHEAFRGFKKNVSVNYKINSVTQLRFLAEALPEFNGFILDRDLNRNLKQVSEMIRTAGRLGLAVDLLINEGCLPYCPNKVDHNIFITMAAYSDQDPALRQCKEICLGAYREDRSVILRTPFLTREMLARYDGRFFKIVDRRKPVEVIDQTLDYYVNGTPVDIGIAFSNICLNPDVRNRLTGLMTDDLPAHFHEVALNCANRCFECDVCSQIYKNAVECPPDRTRSLVHIES
jgi:hypothetical protein